MSLSFRPDHLGRYRDVVHLIRKYGGSDLVRFNDEPGDPSGNEQGLPEELAEDLEKLGPTYIKLGQLLSSRPDILPEAYVVPLARLQDNVEPVPFDQIVSTVESELGVSIRKAFDSFEEKPVAAASLGQVHRAVLRGGREVAVKVQRPDIRKRILTDLDSLAELAGVLDRRTAIGRRYGFEDLLSSFRRSLLRELDYETEAGNLTIFRNLLASYFRILIPEPVADYTTPRVLTMELVRGIKITRLSPLVRLEMEGEQLAIDLARAYLDQILIHGVVHADPHPGNVFITSDRRLALLDLGMVMYLTPATQETLIKLLLAISERRSDEVANHSMALSVPLESFDEKAFRRDVSDIVAAFHGSVGNLQVGRIMMDVARISGENGLRPAPELAMLGKTLFNLDAVIRMLSPDVDPNDVIRNHALTVLRSRLQHSFSTGTLFTSALDFAELLRSFPSRMNRALDTLSRGELVLKVRVLEERQLLSNLQKIANRIALGVVLAALIIGAAMLMRVPTRVTIFGYPPLAMILFLAAVILGFWLVLTIMYDGLLERRKKKRGPG